MNNVSENFDFITRGGLLMYPLIALSIYTVTVVILKIMQIRKLKPLKTGFMDNVVALIRSGHSAQAEEILRAHKGPVAKVAETTIKVMKDDGLSRALKESEIERIGAQEIKGMESHLRSLEMVSNISPLIGLLGTVIGMVKAFAKIAESGSRVDPGMLAGGIWEALVTTIGGLIVAIPALAAYYIIDGYVERVRNAMKDAAVRILVLENFIRPAHVPATEPEVQYAAAEPVIITGSQA